MDTEPKRTITWFRAATAPDLAASGIMTSAPRDPEAAAGLDLTPLSAGTCSRVLFSDPPDGFSLVHLWFGENFPLPRHTHSGDCLYYVLEGELRMGAKTVTAGDGFFIPARRPYTYRAGPGGVEVLEFRASSSFDIENLEWTPAKLAAAAAAGAQLREAWDRTRPDW